MLVMKWKQILLSLLSAAFMPAAAEVHTFQGSTRWNTTFFRTNTNTAAGTTSYTTYYLVESFSGYITDQVKVDAWSARNPATGRVEKYYYIDRNFAIEYGYFGRFGTDVGGGMQFDGIEAISPFRGTYSSGALRAFTLYPSSDYYRLSDGLDVTQITGSARLNTSFSGNVSLGTALNAVLSSLENKGYFEAL